MQLLCYAAARAPMDTLVDLLRHAESILIDSRTVDVATLPLIDAKCLRAIMPNMREKIVIINLRRVTWLSTREVTLDCSHKRFFGYLSTIAYIYSCKHSSLITHIDDLNKWFPSKPSSSVVTEKFMDAILKCSRILKQLSFCTYWHILYIFLYI